MFKPKPPPKGTITVLEHEARLTGLAAELEAAALQLLRDRDDRIGLATSNQLALSSIRARKVAAELGLAREAADRDEWILGEARELGLGNRRRS